MINSRTTANVIARWLVANQRRNRRRKVRRRRRSR